ncbi:MAG: AAA family ATPase [bacterium]|nr:AAA family ATPase [bacterium]
MAEWAKTHLPCIECGSSDALSVNEDGWGTCFACDWRGKMDDDDTPAEAGEKAKDRDLLSIDIDAIPARAITAETCRVFGYGWGEFNGEEVHVAPYRDKRGKVLGQKIRTPDKKFVFLGGAGKEACFFGRLTKSKQLVITEGEIDAMSVSQALGNTWPVVSVPNGASGAKKAIGENLEILQGYEKIILCFDDDDPGREGVDKLASMLPAGKAHVMSLPDGHKDANDVLMAGLAGDLRSAVWQATPWRPGGIVNLREYKERIRQPLTRGTPYPWKGLDDMLYGQRPGELYTWTAGTGTGKTYIVSELAHHLITKPKLHPGNTGLIFLEEAIERTGRRIVGIAANAPLHLPGAELSDEDFDKSWNKTLGSGRCFGYDHFGSLDAELLINRVRYLAAAEGCSTVILDHVSMVVSGMDTSVDERRELDWLMTNLRMLTQETGITLHVISHLKRVNSGTGHEDGHTVSLAHLRGTQAIAQLSDAVIAAERKQQAQSEAERNLTVLRVLKNRYAGLTGLACALKYNAKTGRLKEAAIPEGWGTQSRKTQAKAQVREAFSGGNY